MMQQAIEIYRANFKPSAQLAKPYVMLGFNVFAADTDEEAHFRATSMQQAFVNLRTGRPSKLPPPVAGYLESCRRRNARCWTRCCRAAPSARRRRWRPPAAGLHRAHRRRRADDHLADLRPPRSGCARTKSRPRRGKR
jgi:alkanesulfonate monooxygenase SsuD/methylene tetrahydromethanopterin reductase-like flavin-dependent oxidoreductase (luciferase family)